MKPDVYHLSLRRPIAQGQTNRRQARRYPTSQRAWIMRNEEQICSGEIVDMSAGGAQIKFARERVIPDDVRILILGETYMKDIPVSIQWRDSGRMGVKFLSHGVVY